MKNVLLLFLILSMFSSCERKQFILPDEFVLKVDKRLATGLDEIIIYKVIKDSVNFTSLKNFPIDRSGYQTLKWTRFSMLEESSQTKIIAILNQSNLFDIDKCLTGLINFIQDGNEIYFACYFVQLDDNIPEFSGTLYFNLDLMQLYEITPLDD